MSELEERFHEAMVEIYRAALRECNYKATYFLRMVEQDGGVKAAKRLLAGHDPQSGFTTLWECKRLDLTVEAHVIRPEYAELFTADEIDSARRRLTDYGYKFDV